MQKILFQKERKEFPCLKVLTQNQTLNRLIIINANASSRATSEIIPNQTTQRVS